MQNQNDTIVAQATAAGEGGIAILRMSGSRSADILRQVFFPMGKEPIADHRLVYGRIMDGEAVLDEAMAVLMRAPRSYTREDVAEIHCHGSQALVGRILALLCRLGARPADPGEFTYRAFLAGRIDLAQAEAVMRLIRADSERAMTAAIRQMEGGVSAFIQEAREQIIAMLSEIAAAIDFPDEVEEQTTAALLCKRCQALRAHLSQNMRPEQGRIEAEGLRVALCGLPNAGKSSLMNALLGAERAIVTAIPGTTRDTITETLQIDGLSVHLTDTAGLREATDAVEQIGVARAEEALRQADVRLLVIDDSQPLSPEDIALAERISPHLIVLNKADLPAVCSPEDVQARLHTPVCAVSALHGQGLSALRQAIAAFAPPPSPESCALTQARHIAAAERACQALSSAEEALHAGFPLDMAAIDLREALACLGEIVGETGDERVIDEVFSRFCVGK